MTDQEARKKYPNVAKLADLISQEDKQTQNAMILLLVAAGLIGGIAE